METLSPRQGKGWMPALILGIALLFAPALRAAEVAGLEIGAVDLERSAELYRNVLGFAPVEGKSTADEVHLSNGGVEIILRRATQPAAFDPARQAHIYLNLEVSDLAATTRELEKRGLGLVAPPKTTAIGLFAALRDPAGNVHQIVERQPRSPQPFPPRVFNLGIRIESMTAAKAFYCGTLGFEVQSENHPPPIIPLKLKGKAPLILFEGIPERAEAAADRSRTVLLLDDPDLAATLQTLRQKGVAIAAEGESVGERWAVVEDPSGNRVKLRQAGPHLPVRTEG
jgi:predicted enzyme related to lactoylglutathione lyase